MTYSIEKDGHSWIVVARDRITGETYAVESKGYRSKEKAQARCDYWNSP